MTTRIALALVILSGLGACSKPNDLPRLEDQAAAVPARYKGDLDALGERIAADDKANGTLSDADGNKGASDRIASAKSHLDAMTNTRNSMAAQVQSSAKGGALVVQKLIDETDADFETGLREANDDLSAYEVWSFSARRRPGVVAQAGVPAMSANPMAPPPTPSGHDSVPAGSGADQSPAGGQVDHAGATSPPPGAN